jgi:hypothetical protein
MLSRPTEGIIIAQKYTNIYSLCNIIQWTVKFFRKISYPGYYWRYLRQKDTPNKAPPLQATFYSVRTTYLYLTISDIQICTREVLRLAIVLKLSHSALDQKWVSWRDHPTIRLIVYILTSTYLVSLRIMQKEELFFSWRNSPLWVRSSSLSRHHDHTQTHHTG